MPNETPSDDADTQARKRTKRTASIHHVTISCRSSSSKPSSAVLHCFQRGPVIWTISRIEPGHSNLRSGSCT
ncbi:hypothetical protein MRX96_000591 [Rhipicephalus microplus]